MEKNKLRLAGRLLCLALGAWCVLAAAGYIREIRGGRESIARLREALRGEPPLPPGYLSRLEERLERARETAEEKQRPPIEGNSGDPVGRIRSTLQTHAIGVERLRTLSAGGAGATELVLSSAPARFLGFLQGAAELPLSMNYLSIKPNASALDVTVRFSHEL